MDAKGGEEEMATKLYNYYLSKIIFECNEYYILNTDISLVDILVKLIQISYSNI